MTKKIISLALVVVMLFSFTVTAFAADTATPNGTQVTDGSDFTDAQITTMTSLIKSNAIFYSVIEYKLDRSVYYDPIIMDMTSNGDGTYSMTVRSGFTFRFYYTVKVYMAANGTTVSDLTYIDQYGYEHDTTDGIDDVDDFYRYDSLFSGLVAYGIDYLKSLIVDSLSDLF